jgi:hypothetical protein
MSPGAMHRLVPTIGIGSHGADENDNIENPGVHDVATENAGENVF